MQRELPVQALQAMRMVQTSGTVPLQPTQVCWAAGLTWAVAFATVSPAPLPYNFQWPPGAGDWHRTRVGAGQEQ